MLRCNKIISGDQSQNRLRNLLPPCGKGTQTQSESHSNYCIHPVIQQLPPLWLLDTKQPIYTDAFPSIGHSSKGHTRGLTLLQSVCLNLLPAADRGECPVLLRAAFDIVVLTLMIWVRFTYTAINCSNTSSTLVQLNSGIPPILIQGVEPCLLYQLLLS